MPVKKPVVRSFIPIKDETIKSWSFSRYGVYKMCPLQAKYKFILKIKEPGSDAMRRGDGIHKIAENYIKGFIPAKMPPELKLLGTEFKMLRELYKKKIPAMIVEDTFAFCADWSLTSWNDWNGCVIRIKVDCAHYPKPDSLMVTDWKTGKFREEMNEDYVEQLELYALGALVALPHIKEVRCRLGYIDGGFFFPPTGKEVVWKRADVPKLKELWAKRTKALLSDKKFAPRPNDKCRWCWYGQSKRGMVIEGMTAPGLCKY